ncbi:MAG: ankyrin repeat domain-containing protein [candidate division WOR-3 bacterium]
MDLNGVLIQAAKDGNMFVLKAAIEKGADINAKDKYGWTALMWASINGHTETVEYLKEKGADTREIIKVLISKLKIKILAAKKPTQPQYPNKDLSRELDDETPLVVYAPKEIHYFPFGVIPKGAPVNIFAVLSTVANGLFKLTGKTHGKDPVIGGVQILGELGIKSKEVVKILKIALEDNNEGVKQSADEALKKLGIK